MQINVTSWAGWHRNPAEAALIRRIYTRYLELGCVRKLQLELKAAKFLSKRRTGPSGKATGGVPYSRGALYSILANRFYIGEIAHRGHVHPAQHESLIDRALWDAVQERLRTNSSARRLGITARRALRRALGIKGHPVEAGVAAGTGTAPHDEEDVILDVPAKFRRLSGAVRMIVPQHDRLARRS